MIPFANVPYLERGVLLDHRRRDDRIAVNRLNKIAAAQPDLAAWESLATALGELIRDTAP